MEFENLITLIQTVSSSELTDFSMEEKELKISMKKKEKKMMVMAPEKTAADLPLFPGDYTGRETAEDQNIILPGNQVKAPLVGTYYSASAPDADDFVKVGDTVKKGQTLGIIEAMKLMNEIESDYDGVVEKILVENGQMVEYGQVLFIIK